MPKVRLRKRGKRGGRRGTTKARSRARDNKKLRIYDLTGKLIMVGTVADWRESVQIRKDREEADRRQLRKRSPGSRFFRSKRPKPLLAT
jgi:hypothetical protein